MINLSDIFNNKKLADRKCFIINIDKIIDDPLIKYLLREKVKQVNELQFIVSHFIRAYLLYLYNENKQLPYLNKDFIMTCFRLFLNSVVGPKEKNIELKNKLETFYSKQFKNKFNINKFNYKNISCILLESATEMAISYKNNIILNFYKYLNQFVNQYFQNDLNEFIKNEKNNKDRNKKKKEFLKDLRSLKDALMKNDENMCPNKYKKWYGQYKDKILPKLEKSDHIKQLKYYPFKYLQYMIFMNSILEQKELKMFQPICLRTDLKNKHITINTNALIYLIIPKNKTKYLLNVRKYADKLWNSVLNTNKFTYKNYSFNHMISTNGKVVCINLININKIKTKNEKIDKMKKASKKSKNDFKNLSFDQINKVKNDKYDKQINNIINKQINTTKNNLSDNEKTKNKLSKNEFQYIEDIIKYDEFKKYIQKQLNEQKIVYGDPGKRDIIKFYGENGEQFKYSSKRRSFEIKRDYTLKLIESKKEKINVNINNKNMTIKEVEKLLSNYNAKTTNYNKFNNYCQIKFQLKNEIVRENSYNMYLLKHQWYSHINKIRHESQIINEIRDRYGQDALFIIGDWNAKNKLPYISTPGIGFKRLMANHFKVNIIDEYNTSKLNFKTFEKNKNLEVNCLKNSKHEKISLYSVFTYKMSNGRYGCINRDLNSVYNMQTIVHSLIKTNKRPKEFIQKKQCKLISNPENRNEKSEKLPSIFGVSETHIGKSKITRKNNQK